MNTSDRDDGGDVVAEELARHGIVAWAGRMRIEYVDHTLDVVVGATDEVESRLAGAVLVAGRGSPLGEVFLRCRAGDSFTAGGVTGIVRERSLFPGVVLPPETLRPRPEEAREREPDLVDVTLSPAQERAVSLPAGRSQLVLGEAGHGKTTVALHRLARLHRAAEGRFRAVVIVPGEGLRDLLERMLVRVGADVPVTTYDEWAMRQRKRAFSDTPSRESTMATPEVRRLKRDPALRSAIAAIAAQPPALIDDDRDAPRVRSRAHARRADLQRLFGDRTIVEDVRRASDGRIGARAVEETLEHTHVQFSQTGEEEWAHVTDAQRLVTLDGGTLDQGTPADDAGTIDVEDVAVLFELDRQRALLRGRRPTRPSRFDCIVVDEAQELSPLELSLVGRSLAPEGTLVVAGDAEQQLDAATWFESWDASMRELGVETYDTTVLEVGYRCPPDVVATAHRALGRQAPGAPPPIVSFAHELLLADWLAEELRALRERDRGATVAIVLRDPVRARRLAALLRSLSARLVLGGRFTLGVPQVTTVDDVRGVEFDHVVIPDATSRDYPDTPRDRRAMYVAVTRARHQVVLCADSAPTTIFESRA